VTAQKRTTPFNWDDVRIFARLAECGTLSATARVLKVTHVTVARRLAELEAALGQTLFYRKAEGYHLTSVGEAALREAMTMEQAALNLMDISHEDKHYQLIRISATRALSDYWLIDQLKVFGNRHSNINFELVTESRNVSLAHREADIAIRLARPVDSDTVGRSVAEIHFGLYGRQDVVTRYRESGEACFIGFSDESAHIPEAEWINDFARGYRFVLRTNSLSAQLSTARDGKGLALLPFYLTADEPELVQVPLSEPLPKREIWLMARRDVLRKPAIRQLFDFLVEAFRTNKALFYGSGPIGTTPRIDNDEA
jgi:DNA-binding transcriptional LysR family regulator